MSETAPRPVMGAARHRDESQFFARPNPCKLRGVRKPLPSPLLPIRADGGSGFMADCGQACEQFGIVSPEAARVLIAKSDAPVHILDTDYGDAHRSQPGFCRHGKVD